MSRIGELLLRAMSRDPYAEDYPVEHYEAKHADVDIYVQNLRDTFPGIEDRLAGSKVLDIGCAEGMETLALSVMGASDVHGIDIRIPRETCERIQREHPDRNMRFSVMDAHQTSFDDGEFDVVVTCSSFEHFRDPAVVLKEAKRVLKEDGTIFVTSSVWSSPWGAHMTHFTKVPWVQFLFSEKTIMNVRRDYRDDGATRYHEVEGGLNKVGIRSFGRIADDLQLHIAWMHLRPVKNLTPLTKLPYVNELFTGAIIAELRCTH